MKRRRGMENYLKPPSIEVDGICYKSDRFYLNGVQNKGNSSDDGSGDRSRGAGGDGDCCSCGFSNKATPLPLFHRERLIQSQNLKAAIFGTFSLDLQWMSETFPNLVGPKSTVPTLILHGAKGLNSSIQQDDENGNKNENGEETFLGSRLYLSEVPTTCKSSDRSNAVSREKNTEKKQTTTSSSSSREYKQGVHHPKFMLLFTKEGDLIVVVSTANLVKTQTTEGSWVQKFSPRDPRSFPRNSSISSENDFGTTLTDFLKQLSKAVAAKKSPNDDMAISTFLSKYLNLKLDDLGKSFQFQKAKVHLVPIIPGNFPLNHKKYGRRRVESILENLMHVPTSNTDELLIQPTSLGGNWTRGRLAHVVKTFLGCNHLNDDDEVLERMKIVWPSMSLVNNATVPSQEEDEDGGEEENKVVNDKLFWSCKAVIYLSAKNFNSCDAACISRMAQYENSQPLQQPNQWVPHIKSVARLCKKPNLPSAETIFSWFLLTSACLSYGSAGKINDPYNPKSIAYSNFELGILFTSQFREGKPRADDRVYCFRPSHCCCCDNSKLIHLPVPYSLKAKLYMEESEICMDEMPFFNEIEKGDRCAGNMRMTLWGSKSQPLLDDNAKLLLERSK